MTKYEINSLKSLLLDYEISSSWWAGFIGFEFLQRLSAKYFAWKVSRKFRAYIRSKAVRKIILENS